MKNKLNITTTLFLLIFLGFVLNSCSENSNNPIEPEIFERGQVSESTQLATYTKENIEQLLNALNFSISFPLSYTVQTYSVKYYTIDKDGNEQLASGALFFPEAAAAMPTVSIQHGTQTHSMSVASVSPLNSVEGMSGLIFASAGYYILVPDYLGFGVSDMPHPYVHAKSLTPCVIDFIRAGKSFAENESLVLNDQLFLTGYSEGGYVTLAAQKDIETNYSSEFILTAVAPMAGPYDLLGTAEYIFEEKEYSTPLYLAYLFTAYDNLYKWNKLDAIFKTPYAERMTSLFDGSKRWDEISLSLPSTFDGLIKEEFVISYSNGNEPELKNALQENSLLSWTPVTPIHLFHGDADEVVPYQNAVTAMETFKSRGATSVKITTIEGGTHGSAGPAAILGTFEWFENYRLKTISLLD